MVDSASRLHVEHLGLRATALSKAWIQRFNILGYAGEAPAYPGGPAVNTVVNVLFVCSKNQWRSPTAEKIFRDYPSIKVRSAGVASSARHQINGRDIEWADVIMVMENKHLQRLRADYASLVKYKQVHILDIPDEYTYMDPDLVYELHAAVDSLLEDL